MKIAVVILLLLCMVSVGVATPRFTIFEEKFYVTAEPWAGTLLLVYPVFKTEGIVGTDFLVCWDFRTGVGASPTTWGLAVGHQIIFSVDGMLYLGIPWSRGQRPLAFGAGLKARW